MKQKLKTVMKVIAMLAIILLVCILIMVIPGALGKVSEWVGKPVETVKNALVTVIGTGVGLTLISFGVASLALPIVAIPLIVVGLVLVAWSLYSSGWFSSSSSSIPIGSAKLNKVA